MKNTKENATLKANPAQELRAELARKIASFMGKEENRITEIPGVSLHRRTSPTPPCRTTYHPGIIVVAQGSKQVNLGKNSFIYDESHLPLDRGRFADCELGGRGHRGNALPRSVTQIGHLDGSGIAQP